MNTLSVVESVFLAALEKDPAEARAAYLDEACGGDPNLRRCVERLLNAQPNAGSFLQAPLPETEPTPLEERPGRTIGPYKLLQELGEGGFGVVFLAEQTEPVQRRVALKVIKPGMDSKQVVARFEQERQALAMMDHPNIAKVLDGGTTESGRPYFVMELVKGVPITKFCDDNRLSPRERLGLFVPVCQAIQHAHQKGVIHRDVKPSNVLVATYDDRPVVKVIDFGVAKAVDQRLTERTLFTNLGQVIGTLEYMSPEQASLNALDVDTRSDVYALGVLLYELLTGSTPLDKEKLRAAGFAEMLRQIREEEPPRPSDRISGSGEGLPLLAAYRKTESQKLPGVVRGELDWIAMRALEKDRSRRYESPAALAADVGRYLEDEPVEACPPSLLYRAGKFARKHRAALTLATTAAALLVLGVVGSGLQAMRATRAEADAVARRGDAEEAREAATAAAGKEKAAREQVRRQHYALSMSLVQAAWQDDDMSRAWELLDALRPAAGEEDLRGFEWNYWRGKFARPERSWKMPAVRAFGAMSGDGERVAYVRDLGGAPDWPGTLEVAQPATGRVVWSRRHEYGLGAAAFSADGKRLAAEAGGRLAVGVCDLPTGKEDSFRFSLGRISAYSVEGSRAVAEARYGQGPRRLMLCDFAAPGKPPVEIGTATAPRSDATVAFNRDGSRAAVGTRLSFRQPSVKLLDAVNGKALGQSVDVGGPVALAFSPDGKRLAALCAEVRDPRFRLLLWDCLPDGSLSEARRVFLGASGEKGGLAYSADGGRLAAWVEGAPVVRIMDAADGAGVEALHLRHGVHRASFSADGSRLRVVSVPFAVADARPAANATLSWHEYRLAARREKPPFPSPERLLAVSGDGARRLVSPRNGPGELEALVVKDREGKEEKTLEGHRARANTALFSPSGGLILVVTTNGTNPRTPPEALIWEVDTGKVVRRWEFPHFGRWSGVRASDDGRLLVQHDKDGGVVLDFETLRERFRVGDLASAQFSPDGRRLVTMQGADGKGEGRLWDTVTGRLLTTLPPTFHAIFSDDGRFFACNTRDGPARLQDAGDGRLLFDIPAGYAKAFSRDGRHLVIVNQEDERDESSAEVWDTGSGKPLYRLAFKETPDSFAFSPDGGRLACYLTTRRVFASSHVRLWDVRTGVELLQQPIPAGSRGGSGVQSMGPIIHRSQARTLSFSDDGRRLTHAGGEILDATPLPEGK